MQYANRLGYSDVEPFEVLREVKPGVVEIRAMKAKAAHKHKDLAFQPGGFFGHCASQENQRWEIKPDAEAPVIVARLCKAKASAYGRRPGYYYDRHGNRYQPAEQPCKFYDFNF